MSLTETHAMQLGSLIKRLRSLRLMRMPPECELPPGLVAMLDWVANSPGCGVLELADGLGVTPPTVSVGVRRLMHDGWLESRQHPEDRRAKPLYITPKSETLLEQLRRFQSKVMLLFLAQLSEGEQETFLSLFDQAISAMEERLLDNTWKESQID